MASGDSETHRTVGRVLDFSGGFGNGFDSRRLLQILKKLGDRFPVIKTEARRASVADRCRLGTLALGLETPASQAGAPVGEGVAGYNPKSEVTTVGAPRTAEIPSDSSRTLGNPNVACRFSRRSEQRNQAGPSELR
jgi:hypothetical protein